MLTLQTVYPYGLNDRVGDEHMVEKESRLVGNNFLPLHRLYKSPDYNLKDLKINLKDAGYFIRVSIRSFKKSFLKQVCNDVYDSLIAKQIYFPTNNGMK